MASIASPTTDQFLESVARDARLVTAAARKDLETAVPTCPGWTLRDLLVHLGRIHREKEQTVRENLTGDEFNFELPAGDPIDWFEEGVELMLIAFRTKKASDPVWTWYSPDQTVGFWYRRMAHETLIHRADAELAQGKLSDVDQIIAEDGIDEALGTFIAGYPAWATLETQPGITKLSTPSNSWFLRSGSFSGTTRSGKVLTDIPTVLLEQGAASWDCEISGSAAALDLWLWGRGPLADLEVVGDASLADYLRDVAAKST